MLPLLLEEDQSGASIIFFHGDEFLMLRLTDSSANLNFSVSEFLNSTRCVGVLSCTWDDYLEGGFGSWAPLNGGDSQAFFWLSLL